MRRDSPGDKWMNCEVTTRTAARRDRRHHSEAMGRRPAVAGVSASEALPEVPGEIVSVWKGARAQDQGLALEVIELCLELAVGGRIGQLRRDANAVPVIDGQQSLIEGAVMERVEAEPIGGIEARLWARLPRHDMARNQ